MCLHRRLIAGLIACSTLASCAASRPPVSAPPRPLPVEYSAPCPPPAASPGNHADEVAVALKEMYDLYGLCAGRLVDLVDYLQEAGGRR